MKDETLLPDFDAWSRRCEIQLLLCNREFREVAEFTWNEACRATIQSGNSAQPVTVPDGYVLVPVEPTPEMCDVGHIGIDVLTGVTSDSEYYSTWGDSAAKLYRAMLAAAPKVPYGWIPVSDDAEPPREGWLLTHKGRDYFYRNQNDATAHMDAAIDANDFPLSILHMEHNDGPVVVPNDRLQKAIVDACTVFLHGCDGLSKNYECDFGDAETEHSFCMAEVAKKAGVVEETGNRRWSLCKEMKGEIEAVYRKYAMRIMEAAPKVKP